MRGLGLVALSSFFATTPAILAQDGNWTTKPPMPEAREGQAAAVIDGLLYVAGGAHNGVELGTFEAYDPVADTWSSKAAMPTPREHLGAGVVNGVFYALGGVATSGAVANVDAYDPTTNVWSTKAPMATLRTDFNVVAVGNILYAIGGYDGAATGDAQFKSVVEAYDATTDTWTTKSAMPGPRAAAAVGVVSGKIYLAAGFGLNFASAEATYCYDPATDSWTTLAAIPIPRTGNPLGGVVNGIFYVAGGAVGNTVLNTVEAFDPSTNSWSTVSSLPTSRIYLTGGVINNTFYAVGGSTSGAFASSNAVANNEAFTQGPVVPPPPGPPVITNPLDLHLLYINEAFDPGSNTWTAKAAMPTAREIFAMAQADGSIYVAGGEVYNNCTPIDTFEVYNSATDTWRSSDPDSTSYDPTLPPMPTHRWQMDAASLNGIIYVAGGSTGCPGTILDTFESYNPVTNTWRSSNPASAGYDPNFPHMPTPRWSAGVVALGTRIYVVGGATEPSDAPLDTLEAYDTATNTWLPLTHLNTPRAAPFVAALNGKIYAIGGRTGVGVNSVYINTVEEYDPNLDTWVNKTSPMPTTRAFSGGVAVLNGAIYVVGGLLNGGNVISTVEAYHPALDGSPNAWTTEPSMPTARANCHAAVVAGNNSLYSVGGASDGAATAGQPFVYQITATNHPTSYTASGLPAGLSFDNISGIVYGTPTSSVDAHVTFTATNGSGTGSKDIRIFVEAAPPADGPGIIVNSTCATGRTAQQFTFQVLTKNASPAARLTAGGLPPGFTLDPASNVISGIPATTGTFGVVLGLTDGPKTISSTVQLTFISDPVVPIITSSDSAILVPGQPMTPYTITADVDGSFSYIGSDGQVHTTSGTAGLPQGLMYDASSHTISGTYTGNGNDPASISGSQLENIQTFGHAPTKPKTLKIRPPLLGICQLVTDNTSGTGTRPLNFFGGHAITLDASPSAGGTVDGAYNNDGSFTATATTANCYNLVSWTENDVVQSTSATYTFTPTADRSLVANFAKISYAISTSGAGGTLTGAGSYDCGSSVTVTVTPDNCHTFVSWTENGVVQSSSSSYQFTASADRSLVANFDQISYGITANAGTGGTVSGGATYACGANVTLTATPDSGYDFTNWTEGGTVVAGAPATYQFNASSNRTLVANFIPVVSTPTISPSGGTFKKKVLITMSCATAGASIYYTTDGTDPTNMSSLYPTLTGKKKFKGIQITGKGPHTVKAKGINGGFKDSPIATANFTIN